MRSTLLSSMLGFLPLCLLAVAGRAHAQAPLPEGTLKHEQATTGVENVVAAKFEATKRAPEDDKDATELRISAGGMSSGGNARSLGLTTSGKFRLRRGANEVGATVVGNYGRAAAGPDQPVETTVENLQGKVRYDRYISGPFAAFLGLSGLHDRFLGLDLRTNLDPGVAYYVLDEKLHRLWPELGYDLQHDIRRDETLELAAAQGQDLDKTETTHNLRAFLGYDNDLAQGISFDTGVELLKSLTAEEAWRLNWDVAFNAAVAGNLSLAVTLNFKYDNDPLPGVLDTDLTSALSLVYQVL